MPVNWEYTPALSHSARVSGAITSTVSSTANARLVCIIVSNAAAVARTVNFYNAASAVGTPFLALTLPASSPPTVVNLWPGLRLSVGLTVVGAADCDVTVIGRWA